MKKRKYQSLIFPRKRILTFEINVPQQQQTSSGGIVFHYLTVPSHLIIATARKPPYSHITRLILSTVFIVALTVARLQKIYTNTIYSILISGHLFVKSVVNLFYGINNL